MKVYEPALWALLAVGAAAMIRLFSVPVKPWLRIPLNGALAVALLAVFNYFGAMIKVTLGLNLPNSAVVAFLGPVGIPVLLMAKWILNI
jgi:hypothetical protein